MRRVKWTCSYWSKDKDDFILNFHIYTPILAVNLGGVTIWKLSWGLSTPIAIYLVPYLILIISLKSKSWLWPIPACNISYILLLQDSLGSSRNQEKSRVTCLWRDCNSHVFVFFVMFLCCIRAASIIAPTNIPYSLSSPLPQTFTKFGLTSPHYSSTVLRLFNTSGQFAGTKRTISSILELGLWPHDLGSSPDGIAELVRYWSMVEKGYRLWLLDSRESSRKEIKSLFTNLGRDCLSLPSIPT